MSHFYLTLPSNSSAKHFPNNTKAHFITKLLGDYELQGDWEVGLSEIIFPKSWYNVGKKELIHISFTDCYIHGMHQPNHTYTIHIQEDYYSSLESLVQEINDTIAQFFKSKHRPKFKRDNQYFDIELPEFKVNAVKHKVKISVISNIIVVMSPSLSKMLGYRKNLYIRPTAHDVVSTFESHKTADIHSELQVFYAYCDLLECVPVGDTRAPLLRIVDVIETNHNTTIRRYYDKPHYVPLQKKSFDSIEIDLRTDSGDPVPFERGKVILTLHFKRADGAYFI